MLRKCRQLMHSSKTSVLEQLYLIFIPFVLISCLAVPLPELCSASMSKHTGFEAGSLGLLILFTN